MREMLDLEWSKDDDTKTKCSRLNTSPLHRGNASNKNSPAQVKQRMQWEATSKPLAVDDPLLLPEREVHAEISINWFVDQEIPKGGYVRILAESLLWEECLGKNKNKNYRGPHYMHGAAQRVDNCEQQLEFFPKAMVRQRTRADHGHSRGNRSKRTGEKEKAGYRSPTWSILRAPQKINKAKRLEGEAIMSASPFFQSAGRGDLKFW